MLEASELGLFFFGCFCALIQIPLGLDGVGFGSWYELSTVAANLAASGEFRDPFGVATGPTAHVAPVYTFILALLIRIFRHAGTVIWAAIILNACLLGLAAALLPKLSRRVYGRSEPGVAGGVLLALSGRLIPQWEVALSALLLLVATQIILDGEAGAAGLFCGLSLLANPVSLPSLAILASNRGKRFAVVALAIALAVCLPWLVRNWIVLGGPFFVRDNLGVELFVSNHDKASADVVANEALWTLHPNQNRQEAEMVASMGEGRYNRKRLRDGLCWIQAHPRRFLQLSAQRAFYYWLPPRTEGWPAYSYWVLTILAVAGVWIGRRHRTALLLAAAAVVYSLPFVIVHTIDRHRFPSLWISALLAGYTVITLLKHGRSILAGRPL